MAPSPILTIGHSTLPIADFIDLLKRHSVTAIADVRSAPYSRFTPAFNRESLKTTLRDNGIAYVFVGEELGGRPKDLACYENNRVSYARMAQMPWFHDGLKRLSQGSESHRIAMMCAEQDPLACHRTLLVARVLATRSIPVFHIHQDGSLEPQSVAETRLLRMVGLPGDDLFRSRDELLAEAYALQELRVAYVKPTEDRSLEPERR
jgi:uncharacterized protein (DUF488 family)